MSYWLVSSGTNEEPHMHEDWRPARDRWVEQYGDVWQFTRRPRIATGDRLVTYAVGSARAFGKGRAGGGTFGPSWGPPVGGSAAGGYPLPCAVHGPGCARSGGASPGPAHRPDGGGQTWPPGVVAGRQSGGAP